MLRKLLKYDLAAVWKIWVPLAASTVGMSLVLALAVRALWDGGFTENGFLGMALYLTLFASIFGFLILWIGLYIVTPLLCYIRYYKNFFSDQGYLTFTLPVKRRDLYLSKVLNTFIWSVANALVTLVVVVLLLLLIPPPESAGQVINPWFYRILGEALSALWTMTGGWSILYVLEVVLLLCVTSLCNIGLFHLCITIGSVVAQKHKVLTAVGIYMGVNFGFSFLGQFFSLFFASPIMGLVSMIEALKGTQLHLAVAVLFLLIFLIAATLAVVYHLVTLHLIERKLNLA